MEKVQSESPVLNTLDFREARRPDNGHSPVYPITYGVFRCRCVNRKRLKSLVAEGARSILASSRPSLLFFRRSREHASTEKEIGSNMRQISYNVGNEP